ncbi:MAG: hypothetical protein KF908_14295 [Nitrosomonas sp.]|nr:hypothetical protein [Nitrosomonas sp.]MCW5608758.1 hypothetical protein [Nitrosomonas sp.]
MFDKRNQLVFYANTLIIMFGLTVILFSDFVLVGILFTVIAAILIFEQIKQNKGAFSITDLEKTLTISDTCGTQATLIQKQNTTACHMDNTVYWFKSINPIGMITNFSINGQSPIEQKKDNNNKYQVCMALPVTFKATNGIETTLKCSYKNAFGRTEGILSHTVDDETDRIRLVVDLPKGRPVSTARAYCIQNGEEEALLPPLITGETRIETEVVNPKFGAEYCLQWNWSEPNLLQKIGCYIK